MFGHKTESVSEKRSEKINETSTKLADEQTFDERLKLRRLEKQTSNQFGDTLPMLELVDKEETSDASNTLDIKIGDKIASLEFDESGKPKCFYDINGDKIYRTGETWYRSNLMLEEPEPLSDGLKLNDSGGVSFGYLVKKNDGSLKSIRRDISGDGTIITTYPEGPITKSTSYGDLRVVNVESDGKSLQKLTYKNNDLIEVTLPNGTVYSRQEEIGSKPSWYKTTPDGITTKIENKNKDGEISDSAAVKADENGSVVIRDSSEESSKYCRRYLNNGVEVSSNRTGSERLIHAPSGLSIEDISQPIDGGEAQLITRKFSYPNGRVVMISCDSDGNFNAISDNQGLNLTRANPKDPWKNSDGSLSYTEVISARKIDSIQLVSSDGSTQVIDANGENKQYKQGETVPVGKNLEDRSLVQQVPDNAVEQLKKDVSKTEQWKLVYIKGDEWYSSQPIGNDPSMWDAYWAFGLHDSESLKNLKESTKDGGDLDIKQKGGQFEQYGNFQWGVFAASMDMPQDFALRCVGIYKNAENKSSSKYGKVSDLTKDNMGVYPFGQNPEDAKAIEAGYRYYNKMKAEREQKAAADTTR